MIGIKPPMRGEAVMHGVDGAAGRGGGDDREQCRQGDAEARLLAFHVAAVDAERMHQRIAGGFRPVTDGDTGDEQDAHRGQDRPALALVADHAAEDVGQRRAEREDRHHLDQVGDRVGIFEGMRGIGVEEAAAIGAEHLDGDLRGHRTDRDRLLRTFERGGVDIGAERLRHAEPDIDEGQHDAERQQDVERAAGHIDPEIADRLDRGAGKAADQRDRDGDADRGRHEVLHGEAGHLHEVGHRAFAAVVLPVGVGQEADGGVEGEIGFDGGHAGRIVGQDALQPLQEIKHQEADQAEEHDACRIGGPVLLLALAGSRDAIKPAFNRA